MSRKFKKDLITIIENDSWMLDALKIVRELNLNDCWVGAGFVRNKIWDYSHEQERTVLNDIDVIYFDKIQTEKAYETVIESNLIAINPNLNWSVKNQARMHLKNGHVPYSNCSEAISFWPETATSVAIRLNSKNNIEYIAPHGLNDLFNLVVAPTPNFDLTIYKDRIQKKKWKERWFKLNIQTIISY